jgi:adenylate kinase family enzyme
MLMSPVVIRIFDFNVEMVTYRSHLDRSQSGNSAQRDRNTGTLICILGPPGSGKSTLAKALAAELGYVALHSGLLIRNFVATAADGTDRQEAHESVRLGLPVSVELYIKLAKHFLADRRPPGAILDGYPRSLEQCQRMDDILQAIKLPDARVTAIVLHSSLMLSWHRVARRKVCAVCNTELETDTDCCSYRRPTRRVDDSARMILMRTRSFRIAYNELEPSLLELAPIYRLDANRPLTTILGDAMSVVGGREP